MRPVNLIPPEDRRGDHAPLRAGFASYAIVGALALALVGVVLVVLTSNQISDSKAELASLQARKAQADLTAHNLAPYANFASLEDARTTTVSTLAQSRFDWERVLKELALVIPPDVTLENLTGKASADSSVGEASSTTSTSDASVTGPSLRDPGLRPGPGGHRRLPRGPQGHRRRHARRDAELAAARRGDRDRRDRRLGGGRHRQRQLPDASVDRPLRDHRRLRRGARAADRRAPSTGTPAAAPATGTTTPPTTTTAAPTTTTRRLRRPPTPPPRRASSRAPSTRPTSRSPTPRTRPRPWGWAADEVQRPSHPDRRRAACARRRVLLPHPGAQAPGGGRPQRTGDHA